jgi:hypothetical protein
VDNLALYTSIFNVFLISLAKYATFFMHLESFRSSSAVEQSPVKRLVTGSNPVSGALSKAKCDEKRRDCSRRVQDSKTLSIFSILSEAELVEAESKERKCEGCTEAVSFESCLRSNRKS